MNKLFILLVFYEITVPPDFLVFGLQLVNFPLLLVQVSSELADQLPIPLIICPRLQSLILYHQIRAFPASSLFQVSDLALSLMSLSFELCLEDFSVALGLIKVFRKSIELLLPIIELNSVPYLDILLNLHPQDVHIQRHRHLISQTLNLFLF